MALTVKTPVEWLEEQVIKFHNWKINPVFDENCFDEIELRKAIQQAKEMEKEQEKNLFVGTYISIKMEGNKLPYGMKYLALLQSITEEAEKFYDKTLKQRIK